MMQKLYYFVFIGFLLSSQISLAQPCPPPGFPEPGNTCVDAPVLCDNIDGYCATVNNNNVSQNFPGCPANVLNNDEWFAFFAGTTTITIQITPSNCQSSGNQGLQGGIYAGCSNMNNPANQMDLQCPCSTNPFVLSSSNFVVGQIYYLVIDGCAGNVCNYEVAVLAGSTVPFPPDDPGPITGPEETCVGDTDAYSITPPNGATIYNWTLTPPIGTMSGGNDQSVNVEWGNTPGTADLCVTVGNQCEMNPTASCITVNVHPDPTATMSGGGKVCEEGQMDPITITIAFTGDAPWTFSYNSPSGPVGPITTSDNPYTFTTTEIGNFSLQNISSIGDCVGTVSGTVVITETVLTIDGSTTSATCTQSNGAVNVTGVTGGQAPYMFNWNNGEMTEDLTNVPPGTYTVTATDDNGCEGTASFTVSDVANEPTVTSTTVNSECGLDNGSIDVSVSGGASPYTYIWGGGETTEDLANVPAGTYDVTVTGADGCTTEHSVTVSNTDPPITVTGTVVANTTCNGGNGSITTSVAPAIPPGGGGTYTYNWDNGETTPDLQDLTPGTYVVTVSTGNSCEGTASFTVPDEPDLPEISSTTVSATCTQSNGSINVSVTGGVPPYTFNWSGGETTEDLSNVPPGSYSVTVTGANGCTEMSTITVADMPNEPTVTATTTNSECSLSDGDIDVSVSGGSAPYTYIWDSGETTQDLPNVPAGTYTVTVTGADGCTTVLPVTVSNTDPPIVIAATIVANTTCNGGNGSITTTVSPQPPPGGGTYTYSWDTGETTPNIQDLIPGTYTVTVNTGNSCQGVQSFTIPDDPNEPMIAFTTTPSTCDLDNGSINVSVSGGETPYTFNWGSGETTEDLSNIPQGTYSVTVTGANGCTDDATISLTNNNPPILLAAIIDPNEGCGPGNWDGSIVMSISPNPSPSGDPYIINWSTGENTQTISNLQPGSYTVTVNGGGTCETTQTFTVPDQPNPPVINVSTVSTTCGLSNGSASIVVSGGVQPYTILWSNGSTGSSITGMPAGNYSVTVTGANGCSATANPNIPDQPINFNVTSDIVPNSACDPMFNNGSITITVLPSNNNYTINWSTGATGTTVTGLGNGSYSVTVSAGGSCEQVFTYSVPLVPINPGINIIPDHPDCGLPNGTVFTQNTGQGAQPFTYIWSTGATTASLSNVPAGTYTVTVTGANGCTAVASGTLVNQLIPVSLSADVVGNTSCVVPGAGNGSINLTINTSVSNPTITWSNGATGTQLSDLDPGTYSVTVNVGGTCQEILSVTVPNNSEIPSLTITQTPSTCGQFDGEADLTVTGGEPPYSYFWSNGNTSEDLFGVPSGVYSVTVTSAAGCVAETSVIVDESTLIFNVTASVVQNTSCGFPNGNIFLFVSPPGNYSYSWDNGTTDNFLYDLAEGTYNVTVTASGNCFQVFSYNVFDLFYPPDATATASAATCGLSNGMVDLTVIGTSAPYTYQWNNGATTEDLTNVPPGNYNVLITDINQCVVSAQATVANNNVPINISGTPTANTSCTGANGAVNISVNPAGSYTYTWSNGATTEDLANVAAGPYTVTVSSGGNCTSTASYTVANTVQNPNISPTITAAICGEANGEIDLNVTGATPPYTFIWSNGSTDEDQTGLLPGAYMVTVSGVNGCSSVQTFNVANNSSTFSLNGSETPLTSCATDNGAINLTVTPAGAYTIEWSTGSTDEDLADLPAGTYVVTVTESGSCSASATFVVTDNTSNPEISQTISPETCGQEDGSYDITVMGGTTPYTFVWSNGSTDEDLVDVAADDYTVTVTGANGCSATVSAEVPENTISFSIQGTPSANTSCDIINGEINLTITPAGTYTFLWSNGATTEDISGLSGGSYNVVVSAGGDCTASANFNVPSTTADPVVTQTVTASICGESNGGIDLNVSGGQAPYTFLWSNGSTDEDLVNILSGSYSVTVTGANGCVANSNFTVPNNSISINVVGTPQANNSCDTPNGTINITATPASTTYTYLWSNGQTTEDLSGLTPGNYSVTVYEGATCQATANFTVNNNTNAPNVAPTITDAICGQSNGSIDVTANGGTMPYSFLWSNGETAEDLEDVPPGTYDVTVTGADGCSNTASYTVGDEPININVMGTPSANTSCVGGNGGIVLNVTPAGTYTYLWSNGETTQDLAAILPGNYQVTVSAAGDCSSVASFQVADNPELPTITDDVTASICGQPDGAIDISPTGGVAPYTFEWSNGEMTEDLTGILSGSYQVTVTDAFGCSATDSYNVANNSNTFIINGSAMPNTLCGSSNGAVNLDVTPVGTYSFEWSNGEMTEDINGLAAGAYTVTVIDGGTCSATATFNVTNNAPTVNVTGTPTDVLCFGGNTGEIAVTASGGVAPYVFDWTPIIIGNPEDPTGLVAGNYTVVVTDASGCSGSSSFTIGQPNSATQISCAQTVPVTLPGMTDGAAVVNISGGTAPYTISWTPGGSQSNVLSGNFNINNLGEGAYSVLVVDANGCETPCSFNMNTNDCITAVGVMSNSLISTCGDGCITAIYNDANQYLDPDDLLEYVLHTGAINLIVGEIARSDQPTFCFDAATMALGTTYYISAIAGNDDGSGHVDLGDDCIKVSFGTPIVFLEEPVAAIEAPDQIDCDHPQVPLVGSSNMANSTFIWSTSNGVIVGNANAATITAGDDGDYRLIVMANGCADTAFVTVNQDISSLTASIVADPTEILNCTIDAINLIGSVTGANTAMYSWVYNGQVISTNPVITVNQSGTYTLTVTDPTNGCQDVEQIFIDDNTEFPPLFINTPPTLNCLDTVGTLTGGSSINGVQFTWATINGTDTTIIGTGPNVDVNAPGTYYLIGVATNNCVNDISVNVPGDTNPPSANAGNDQSLDCYLSPIELLGSSSTANVDFNWTVNNPNVVISNPNAPGITVDQPGIYTLTVTQLDNNCQAIDQVVVDLYENVPQADLDIAGPDCFGDDNGSIFVEADPANGPYTYSLNGISNGSNNFFAPLSAGNYELLVTDGQGCTWSTLISLPEPQPLIVELGADIIVELGESATLQVQYSVPSSQLDTILWTPSELFPCPEMPCDVMEILPLQQTSVGVTVVDTNGCEASDILALFVRKDRNIYIPNAFSPNGDGANDVFMIYSDKDVVNIKSFLVFSRWGESVFEYYDFVPNNPAFGWDGKHRGETLNPAVFAWFAEVEFVDGQTVLFEGDVTLVR